MRIAMFVDGNNLFYIQKKILNWQIDFGRFLKYFERYGVVVDAYYYTGVSGTDTQKSFLSMLPSLGYAVITKPVKTSGETQKANLDIEIVLDMFTTINTYDLAILVSGDSDFERALQILRANGKKFLLVSTYGAVSKELRNISGMNYIDLEDIKKDIMFF